MFNFRIRVKQILLLMGDFVVFQLSVPIMLLLRYGRVTAENYDQHAFPFLILSLLWLVGFYVAGLYDLRLSRDTLKFFRTYFEGTVANLLLSLGFFYLLPIFGITPRTNLFLFVAIVLVLDYIWRLGFNRLIAKGLFRTRVLFVGTPEDAIGVDNLIRETAPGFELKAVIQTAAGTRFDDGSIVWYASPDAIKDLVNKNLIDTIVIGHKPEEVIGLQDALYETIFSAVTLVDRATFEEIATGRIPLEHISQSWFLSHIREGEKVAYESVKRFFDLLSAIPIGLVTLVLFPFLALLVRVSSPGPILIRQKRVGLKGRIFTLYKFRSMRQDAEADGRPKLASDQKNDPRVTRVGKILRATSLDELPQIWNILRGDMSVIGPRPERPEFVEELTRQMPFYALRHLTRPGVTGWAQVNFRYASSFADNIKKLQYDLYYIKHRSFMLDLSILLKTIRIVLRRIGI
ncbi:MAG: sugar transferase [Patescibacteria group bacterium]|nr:sugar transferase [Patescibacteria group bacterium]